MTILQALNGYYERMAARGEAEAPGFSREKISFAITLNEAGEVIDVVDLRVLSGKRLQPRLIGVPAAVKRTIGILPNRLWDKTAYALGRTAGEGRRTATQHAAFKALHRNLLVGINDPGLVALRRFIETWNPAHFDATPFRPEMLDSNFVFRLKDECSFIHERETARRLLVESNLGEGETCLVTGRRGTVARLHPIIKGVNGTQSSGAALVSFNLDAFSSHSKEQGGNAPTSEEAAARYGEALNRMLDRDSNNRLRPGIGDTTVVFWADRSSTVDEPAAAAAEQVMSLLLENEESVGSQDENQNKAIKLGDMLAKAAEGLPLVSLDPGLVAGTQIHVLGLSPNTARLAVRFWLTNSIDALARCLADHHSDLAIIPKPVGWGIAPAIGRLLVRTVALQERFENISPLLAGEVARAILNGSPYPHTWLVETVIRLRTSDSLGRGWHVAALKACLNRPLRLEVERLEAEDADPGFIATKMKEMLPVALDPARDDPAYQLGRLFAIMEAAQFAALGRVNATIGDRYYAVASSTPARIFGLLLRGFKIHVTDARKRGRGGWIEPKVERIMAMLPSELPYTLKLQEQARFAIGYYHERASGAERARSTHDNTEEIER